MYDQVIGGIHVRESEAPVDMVDMKECRDFLFCEKFTQQFRLRRVVCEKIRAAQKRLPTGYRFMIYEAFRPRTRQIELWDAILIQLRHEHPDWDNEKYITEAGKMVANPHGFGSGHQAGAAVDITLCTAGGQELCLGTAIDEFTDKIRTDSEAVTSEERKLRDILRGALESESVINYPDEWWHFSYGDRLWAEVKGRDYAFFAPVD